MSHPGWITTVFLVLDFVIRLGLTVRVIMRRRPVGVSLAWISVLMAVPLFGALIYLLFGELRLGKSRVERAAEIHPPYQAWLESLPGRYPRAAVDVPEMARMIENGINFPPLPGNALELLDSTETIFQRIAADVDAARSTCWLEFYIWFPGGWADLLGEAVERAAKRGVACRLLVDAIGSKSFLASSWLARLRAAGVHVEAALPAQPWRFLFERLDLRLHRKIVVIDGQIGYTGSMNIADPRFFKQDSGVGEWVDAMVRVQGPIVEALSVTFLEDWQLATGVSPMGDHGAATSLSPPPQPGAGESAIQLLASGPSSPPDAMKAILLQAFYEARKELVLTTPYFVPDESMLHALASAALRGVNVHLILPAKNDSKLVDLASRAFQGDLAAAGVVIHRFDAGLLHTKSISVDGRFAFFGSLNLDPRSLSLNYEITLAVYDPDFAARLRRLQQTYIDRSMPFDRAGWSARTWPTQFAENTARLVGPLL